MTSEQTAAFLLFAVAAAVTPGPSNLILTSIGARAGIRGGLSSLAGVVFGMGFLMFLVAFGIGEIVLDRPLLMTTLKWNGALFLLWLAWSIATGGGSAGQPAAEIIGFRKAAALQWINPKSWLVSAGAAGTYLDAATGNALLRSLTLALLFVAVAAPCCLLWLAAGASLHRRLQSERSRGAFNRAMAGLLAASILLIV